MSVDNERDKAARKAWADWSGQSEPESDWISFRAGYRAAIREAIEIAKDRNE